MADPILCPDCGHDIDGGTIQVATSVVCLQCELTKDHGDITCDHRPSRLFRALLAAEPTDAEVNAAWPILWPTYEEARSLNPTLAGIAAYCYAEQARKILSAAAKVRAGQ